VCIGNERLSVVEQERDSGVIIDKYLTTSWQCVGDAAAAATNSFRNDK